MNYSDKALEKLAAEDKNATFDRYGELIHTEVRAALEEFCRQDEEFAQAVVQGGNFGDCIKAVTKGIKNGISDLEAYQRASEFYFPGAKIRFSMTIDLVGTAQEEKPEKSGVIIDLNAFLQ